MIVLHVISGLKNGGAESQLAQLVAKDQVNEHHVISMQDAGFFGEPIVEAGIPLIEAKMPSGKLSLSGLRILFKAIRTIKPDVIQTWMYHGDLVGGIVGRLAGCANINWGVHHTSLDKTHTSKMTLAVVKICAMLSGIVPKSIICCARSTRDLHLDAGYKSDKLMVAYNGYDPDRFFFSEPLRTLFRSENAIPEKEFVFGMVGRWNPLKDHKNLIDALEKLEASGLAHWRCLMVGNEVDESNTKLTEWIRQAGLGHRISLLGPRRDIEVVMSAIDVLVLPSVSEAFPNVVAEAMLTERPCVVTDVGDSASMVGDHGWVVPANDSDALFRSLKLAVGEFESSDIWSERGRHARQRIIDNFGSKKMIQSYSDIWRQGR